MKSKDDAQALSAANKLRFIVGAPVVLAAGVLVLFILGLNWQHWLTAARTDESNSVKRLPARKGMPPDFVLSRPVGTPPVVTIRTPASVGPVAPNPEAATEPPAAFTTPAVTPSTTQPQPIQATSVGVAENPARGTGIVGKVVLKGTPPAEKEIDLSKDPNCGLARKAPLKTRFYVTDGSGGLADVIVYIKGGLEGKKFDAPATPAVLDQLGCEYTPYVMAMQTKQKLQVKNSDPTFHNIHPMPQVPGNKEENKAQLAGAPPLVFTFESQEIPVKFTCNVHNWMIAYVAVIDHPFFAVSGKDGTFEIPLPPPGRYVLEAFHRKFHGTAGKLVSQEITVRKGELQTVNFILEVAAQP